MNFSRLSESKLRIGAFLAVLACFCGCGSSAPGTIGAALGQQADHRLFVRSMPPGQGAERAGLAVDDEILLIDGKDVRAMSQDDVRRAVRGDVGSTMVLTVLRGTEKREIKVVRTPLLANGKGR
jgi:C-terminal processing protease CtpA/Prc